MPFEKGNTFGAKRRMLHDALKRAVMQDDGERLRRGIEALLDKVAEGERWALEFLRDTLDGKPKQQLEVHGDEDNPAVFSVIQRVIIDSSEDGHEDEIVVIENGIAEKMPINETSH